MTELTPTQIRRLSGALAGARAGLGVMVLLAPQTSIRAAGLADGEVSPVARLAARLFAVREIVLGTAVLERLRFGIPEATVLRLNAICDALDAAVIVSMVGKRRQLGRIAAIGLPIAMSATAVWLRLARSVPS